MKGIAILSFGCRLNRQEAEVIRGEAREAGLADTIIVNSCAVTSEAVAQTRQSIRRLRRQHPDAAIVVTGCAAQTDAAMFAAMPEVNHVLGNDDKMRPQAWQEVREAFSSGATGRIAVSDIMAVRAMRPQPFRGARSGLPRAFAQVQNGCDHRCSFCIIPFGRGNSRSAPPEAVIEQVRALVASGHAEIVLTGVDLTSYGADLPGSPRLGTLTRQILREIPELKRLRISSIDSIGADAELLDAIASEERLMPHLHLSLQAGDDVILKRMKRRHCRRDAIALCDGLRRLRPDIALGADLIAGFPTETEDMFRRSLDLVEECGLTFLHVFPFSSRPGTVAARMPQLSAGVIRERAARLREAGAAALQRRLESERGARRAVLIESSRQGRTEHFLPVAITGAKAGAKTEAKAGEVITCRIAGHDTERLLLSGAG